MPASPSAGLLSGRPLCESGCAIVCAGPAACVEAAAESLLVWDFASAITTSAPMITSANTPTTTARRRLRRRRLASRRRRLWSGVMNGEMLIGGTRVPSRRWSGGGALRKSTGRIAQRADDTHSKQHEDKDGQQAGQREPSFDHGGEREEGERRDEHQRHREHGDAGQFAGSPVTGGLDGLLARAARHGRVIGRAIGLGGAIGGTFGHRNQYTGSGGGSGLPSESRSPLASRRITSMPKAKPAICAR